MLRRFGNLEELSRAAAEEVCRIAGEAVAARGRFMLVLSGGETPHTLYALLASEPYRRRVDWARTEVFWSDERAVKPDRHGSNFRMAEELLLRPLALPAGHLHRIRAEAGAEVAAAEYERDIARAFGIAAGGAPPAFDLLLLGMGPDGHVASLFPHGAAVDERRRWVVASRAPGAFPDRVTLTAPVLGEARHVLLLVAGSTKAEALAKVLQGPRDPQGLPAQLLPLAADRVTWLADEAAAALLSEAGRAAQGST